MVSDAYRGTDFREIEVAVQRFMPRIPGIHHRKAVRALQKIGIPHRVGRRKTHRDVGGGKFEVKPEFGMEKRDRCFTQ